MIFSFIIIFHYVKTNDASFNELVTSMSLILVSMIRLMPVVKNINVSYSGFLSGLPSVNLIYEDLILKKNRLILENSEKLDFTNNIRFNKINFKFKNQNELIFKNLDFEIKKNDAIGIFGPSGSGKTTLINILMGLYDVDNGGITVDGTKISSSNLYSWQSKIGLIPQETFIANTSIKMNICLGLKDGDINQNKLEKVLSDTDLVNFVNSKKNGLNEIVFENGKNLSGGQKQKISLARALYYDKDILIFDEPTSALDSHSEKEIQKTLDNLIGNKTIVIISHKKNIFQKFSKIYQIKDKNLVN